MPALPHFREIAVLALVGTVGALAYGGALLAGLRLFGVRLRRR